MIRTLIAFLLFCTMAQAQTVVRQGSPSMIFGSGAPTADQGTSNQLYYDATGRKMWRRLGNGWTQLGIFNSPTDADITTVAGPSLSTGFYVGVNYDGLESGTVPGVVNVDFMPPNTNQFAYFASRKIRVIRLPISWERVQPTLNQPLDPPYLGYITAAATDLAARGMGLIVDVHNFGGYRGNNLGTAQTPITAFADLWSRLAQALRNQPGVIGYDLMNEPVSLGSNLQPAMQAAVTAIRAFDTTHPILVEGDGYSGAGSWTGYTENASYAIDDPVNRIIYEAHNYLDCDSSGTHSNWSIQSTDPSKAEAGGTTCNSGQTVTVNTGVQRATPFVQWCQSHNYQCMIGEIGTGVDPHWLASLDNELAYLRANNIGVVYFAAGPIFQSYMYNVNPQQPGQQPADLVDTPQMGVLEKYSNFAAIPYALSGPRSGLARTPATFQVVTNGYIAAPVTITPNDGGAGGSFSPSSVTLAAGFGGTATFTYTAAVNAVITISATASNPSWVNPPAFGYSTQPDLLTQVAAGSGSTPINAFSSTSAINSSFVSPVLTLRRGSDGATQSFAYLSSGTIDTAAIATWAGGSTLYLHSLADTAPGSTSTLLPVAGNADEPVWSPTALNGHPAFTLNNSRLQAASDLSGKTAVTVVTTLSIPGGNQCGRLLAWEFTNRWTVPGPSGWWTDDFDSPADVGTMDTTKPHVLVMRWRGQGTGTGKRDLFVDGVNVSSTSTTSATIPVNTGSTGIGDLLYLGWFRFYSPCSTNGTVGDLIVFNGALSDAEVAAATTYEKTRFGL
ncbi:MAG: glycoside hydrolase family 5 protein [Acetobacteraceae bacterium]|nr:glycoside hydrolase family 5 protein [Acetobacteraceae bacterium]